MYSANAVAPFVDSVVGDWTPSCANAPQHNADLSSSSVTFINAAHPTHRPSVPHPDVVVVDQWRNIQATVHPVHRGHQVLSKSLQLDLLHMRSLAQLKATPLHTGRRRDAE